MVVAAAVLVDDDVDDDGYSRDPAYNLVSEDGSIP